MIHFILKKIIGKNRFSLEKTISKNSLKKTYMLKLSFEEIDFFLLFFL